MQWQRGHHSRSSSGSSKPALKKTMEKVECGVVGSSTQVGIGVVGVEMMRLLVGVVEGVCQ